MSNNFKRLFGFGTMLSDPEPLGEDMAPSPHTLAERTALSKEGADSANNRAVGPFVSAANAPPRDFTG